MPVMMVGEIPTPPVQDGQRVYLVINTGKVKLAAALAPGDLLLGQTRQLLQHVGQPHIGRALVGTGNK